MDLLTKLGGGKLLEKLQGPMLSPQPNRGWQERSKGDWWNPEKAPSSVRGKLESTPAIQQKLTPTPTIQQKLTPTPRQEPTPTQAPQPTATPSPIPSHIKELPQERRPYAPEIAKEWGRDKDAAHRILRYIDERGVVRGENVSYDTGELDVPNKTKWDPLQQKIVWNNDPDAPIDQKPDPFTEEMVDSIDRGFFRINNIAFLTYLRGKVERQEMFERGIIPKPHLEWDGLDPQKREEYWDSMKDPILNLKMAKLMYEKQGTNAWFAADPSLK